MMIAAFYISWKGLPDVGDSDDMQRRNRPDVVICDQISACIPILKNWGPLAHWLLPYTPKVYMIP